jgi:predicted enzyme related to lactoylglutathione lyase
MANQFFWYDIMTTDTAAARKFYAEVLGWGTQEPTQAAGPYTVFTVDGRGVAGLMPIPDDARASGARPIWMGYVAVDDVDGAAARLAAQGGRVHRAPIEIPGIIRFAVVADPQGAGFLIAKGLTPDAPPPLPPGTVGTVGWRELLAQDWQAAFPFYAAMFGWTKADAVDMGPMGIYQLFAAGDAAIGGMMTKPAAVPTPHWAYYFNVAAIDAAAARVTAGAGSIVNGPHQVPGGQWIVQCTDPQGAFFALVAPHR